MKLAPTSIKSLAVGMIAYSTLVSVGLVSAPAQAATITNGFTYSVATDGSNQAEGTHYHSSTAGDFGNPAGKAEVGNFFSEEVRGLSEYDLTGLSSSPSAFVTFNVFKAGGLFDGDNDFPFTGNIDIIRLLAEVREQGTGNREQ